MPARHLIARIRNIGVTAHIDAGKTTVTERMLFYAGAISRMGNVDDGTTTTDYMVLEKEKGITITAAAVTFIWREFMVNLIDTPGHVDFTAEVERCLRVLDGVVVVFCGVGGVEAQSETVWRQADRYGVPRLAFINKLDRTGADFSRVVGEMRSRLAARPVPVQLPIGAEQGFRGAVDLVTMEELIYEPQKRGTEFVRRPVPPERLAAAAEARDAMLEALADLDDEIARLYLESRPVPPEEIRRALRAATLAGEATPVLCGAALPYIGIQPLLDAVCEYLPSPREAQMPIGTVPGSEQRVMRKHYPDQPFSALVFKTASDVHGDLSFIRVYSGVMKKGIRLLNSRKKRTEKATRIFRMFADRRDALAEAGSGEIVAAVGLKFATTGDTLCDPEQPVLYERMEFPETVISMAIEPKTNDDKEKLAESLARLAKEDPTFTRRMNEETGQLIVSGMGELHLEILKERLIRDFHVRANMGEPKVSYRETIVGSAEVEGRFVKQTGGHGQFGVVTLHIEPFRNDEPGKIAFEEALKGGVIPREFFRAIENGAREAAAGGVRADYPLINVKTTLVDGKYHEVDSSEIAFERAAAIAFREACRKAGVIILEPIMRLEVSVPEQFVGGIIQDLMAKRAGIEGQEIRGKYRTIVAKVPLAAMFGYASEVRSLSQGRASFTMEPSEYREIPKAEYRKFE